jgi:hypothetical protein
MQGWFYFAQRANYLLIGELFGAEKEHVDAVRAKIARFDQRFFLGGWLRRPFSDIEYKRSRLYYYQSV